MSTKLNDSKYCYVRITKNSNKYHSFVYTHLNDQTILFLAIQFSINHLFTLSLNVKQFYLNPLIRPYQELPFRAKADLGTMLMKGYSTFPIAPALLEPHYQIV